MKPMRIVILAIIACSLCLPLCTKADEIYDSLAQGLNDSAVKMNQYHIPESIYQLDQPTAEHYFRTYFNANPMTSPLRVNLGYPIFFWGSNGENLQKGVCPVLLDKIEAFFKDHKKISAMSEAMAENKELHDDIFYSLIFLIDAAKSELLDNEYKTTLQKKLLTSLRASGLTSAKHQKISPKRYPYVNSLKTQFLMTCFTFGKELDDLRPLMQSIYLDPARKKLFEAQKTLVLDNKSFDMKQLRNIKNYMNKVPQHLRIPVIITCFSQLGSEYNKLITVHDFRCKGSFNVFDTRIGAVSTDQFPKDYKPILVDDFSIILAHEYNHQVDAFYVNSQPNLKKYRDHLLEQAGSSKENYLRNMFDDDFFTRNPNEFIASLSNQYFGDTKAMLSYALQKMKSGNLNQINQFILMASIYSNDKACFFYSMDERGNLRCRSYPVKKEDGLVKSLQVGQKKLSFEYADGMVSAIKGI